MYENETYQAILQRLLDGVSDEFDKRQGSHVYNMQAPTAAELAQFYIALDQVLSFGFANPDMPREYLELRAAELGVYPAEPQRAIGKLTFTASTDVIIPEGTRVSTDDDDPIYAVTTESVQAQAGIPITVPAQAEEPGTSGNVAAGEFTIVVGDLAGVLTVTNDEPFEGGTDEESDESLLERYLLRAREPATSGNAAQYRQWAISRPGVAKARVFPLWEGPGTVRVVLISDDMRAPDSVIVSDVQNYIDPNMNGDGSGVAPIGAKCTVVPATEVPINVSATVTITRDATIEGVVEDFKRGLNQYLSDLTRNDDSLVRYTQIISVLLGIPRVVDFDNLIVNGGESNIEMGAEEVPVVGTVTFVESDG